MSRATSPSMQGSNETKKDEGGFENQVRPEGNSSVNLEKTAEVLEESHPLSLETKTTGSSDENRPSQSPSKPHMNGISMQRWLEEIPEDQHWNSAGYHNKNKKCLNETNA